MEISQKICRVQRVKVLIHQTIYHLLSFHFKKIAAHSKRLKVLQLQSRQFVSRVVSSLDILPNLDFYPIIIPFYLGLSPSIFLYLYFVKLYSLSSRTLFSYYPSIHTTHTIQFKFLIFCASSWSVHHAQKFIVICYVVHLSTSYTSYD